MKTTPEELIGQIRSGIREIDNLVKGDLSNWNELGGYNSRKIKALSAATSLLKFLQDKGIAEEEIELREVKSF